MKTNQIYIFMLSFTFLLFWQNPIQAKQRGNWINKSILDKTVKVKQESLKTYTNQKDQENASQSSFNAEDTNWSKRIVIPGMLFHIQGGEYNPSLFDEGAACVSSINSYDVVTLYYPFQLPAETNITGIRLTAKSGTVVNVEHSGDKTYTDYLGFTVAVDKAYLKYGTSWEQKVNVIREEVSNFGYPRDFDMEGFTIEPGANYTMRIHMGNKDCIYNVELFLE